MNANLAGLLASLAFMPHADHLGVYQPWRVGIECSTGELLARYEFMNPCDEGLDAVEQYAAF